jgi:hypothetical protein
MHTAHRTTADLKRELSKMERRADLAESDGEYEACRQIIICLRAEIERRENLEWRAA